MGEISEDWCQGRTAFGGLTVTAAVRAMQAQVEAARCLRSVMVNFVAPLAVGPARIEVIHLRQGGSLSFEEARVYQDERVCTLLTAAFGLERPTQIQLSPALRPAATPPDQLESIPYLPGITPAFSQHFEYRWTSPVAPYSAADAARVQGWIRARDTAAIDIASVMSLVDAWPPSVISMLDRPRPLSTVTWQANIMAAPPAGGYPSQGWWFFDSQAQGVGAGYSGEQSQFWAPDGRLLVSSQQLVAEFSGK